MNQILDSPLEALAFNYVSFGIFTIVNNLWTWVAVITAAFSFWRIRAAGFGAAATSCSVISLDQDRTPLTTSSIIDRTQDDPGLIPEAEEKPMVPSVSVSAPAVSSVSPLVCNHGMTKGGKFKLTFCYEDDGESDVVDRELTVTERKSTHGDGDGDYNEDSCGEWWESWEKVLSLRKGETGWYRYQDMTVLNGNVVRLWDGLSCRISSGKYSLSSASCLVVA